MVGFKPGYRSAGYSMLCRLAGYVKTAVVRLVKTAAAGFSRGPCEKQLLEFVPKTDFATLKILSFWNFFQK
jgi:hypothetical protein